MTIELTDEEVASLRPILQVKADSLEQMYWVHLANGDIIAANKKNNVAKNLKNILRQIK